MSAAQTIGVLLALLLVTAILMWPTAPAQAACLLCRAPLHRSVWQRGVLTVGPPMCCDRDRDRCLDRFEQRIGLHR